MIKKADLLIKDIKQHEQGGNGVAEIVHLFKPEEVNQRLKLCAVITLKPGCSIGYHRHVDEDEIFYVMQGTAMILDNGKKERIEAGDGHMLKGGQSHSIENIGDTPLKVFALIIPSGV